jgi:hypothetical protein
MQSILQQLKWLKILKFTGRKSHERKGGTHTHEQNQSAHECFSLTLTFASEQIEQKICHGVGVEEVAAVLVTLPLALQDPHHLPATSTQQRP